MDTCFCKLKKVLKNFLIAVDQNSAVYEVQKQPGTSIEATAKQLFYSSLFVFARIWW